MGKKIEFAVSIKEYIARVISKWSVEFSVFMGLIITLYDMDLVDIYLLKTFLTIALTGFFVAVMIKFGIAVYKDCTKAIVESNKCIKESKKCEPEKEKTPEKEKIPENKVKNAVQTIENNLPLIPEEDMPIGD